MFVYGQFHEKSMFSIDFHNRMLKGVSMHTRSRNNFPLSLLLIFLTLCLLLTGCHSQTTTVSEETRFDDFLSYCFREMVSGDSITLHFKLSDPAAQGIEAPSPCFDSLSLTTLQKQCDHSKVLQKKLASFDRSRLSKDQQLTFDILTEKLALSADARSYLLYQSPLGSNGIPAQIPVTLSEYYFNGEEDVKTYLSLLNQIPQLFDEILSFEETRRKQGIVCPDFVITDTIDQIDQFLSGTEEDHLLIQTFEKRINALSCLSQDQKETYINNNRALFEQVVLPTYRAFKTSLSALLSSANPPDTSADSSEDSSGKGAQKERLCQYEDGRKYYELLLKSNVGTSMTPNECITILEQLLSDTVSDLTTLTKQHPDIYSDYLTAKPVLSDTETILDTLYAESQKTFPALPEIPLHLKDLPASLSGTSACAFYLVPPLDSSDANVIYINRDRVDDQSLFSTLAHEGYPGHLYQTNYYQSICPHPLRQLLRTEGYDEGWGTYAQLWSYEHLEFQNTNKETSSALRQFYRDNDILSLALSSLSDLYVNYQNYDPDDLFQFLKTYGLEETHAASIYQYVVENPTTYLSYSIGYCEITRLKEELQKKQGDQFDLLAFHQSILQAGSCPFDILQKQVLANDSTD